MSSLTVWSSALPTWPWRNSTAPKRCSCSWTPTRMAFWTRQRFVGASLPSFLPRQRMLRGDTQYTHCLPTGAARTATQFTVGLHHAGFNLTRHEVAALAERFDLDGKGRISLAAWKKRFGSLLPVVSGERHCATPPVPSQSLTHTCAGSKKKALSPRSRRKAKAKRMRALVAEERVDMTLADELLGGYKRVQNAFQIMDPANTGKVRHSTSHQPPATSVLTIDTLHDPPTHTPCDLLQVSVADFRKALQLFQCDVPERDFKSFLAIYDPRNLGKVSYKEFNKRVGSMVKPSGRSFTVAESGGDGPFDRHERAVRGAAV